MVIPTDRPATGPVRGRRSPFVGVGDVDDGRAAPAGPEFIQQFPYKSCQRTKSPRKVTGHKWPHDKPPSNVPQRKVSIKRKKYAGRKLEIVVLLCIVGVLTLHVDFQISVSPEGLITMFTSISFIPMFCFHMNI